MLTTDKMDLLSKKCVPCEVGTAPMGRKEAEKYLSEINKTRPVIPALNLSFPQQRESSQRKRARIQNDYENWILDQIENDKSGKALRIRKRFKFDSYMRGVDFVNKVAKLAESEGHHPDMYLGWRKVTVNLTTHNIGGLSENDFIMAAKINKLIQIHPKLKSPTLKA